MYLVMPICKQFKEFTPGPSTCVRTGKSGVYPAELLSIYHLSLLIVLLHTNTPGWQRTMTAQAQQTRRRSPSTSDTDDESRSASTAQDGKALQACKRCFARKRKVSVVSLAMRSVLKPLLQTLQGFPDFRY